MPDDLYNIAVYIHIVAMLALLIKFWCIRTCAGVSGKSQLLFALALTAKYVPDLETTTFLYGNRVLKVIYLTLIYCTVISIFIFFRRTYEQKYDTFRILPLLLGCIVAALILNFRFDIYSIIESFGIYLEAMAILVQTHFVVKAECAHYDMFYYMIAFEVYNFLYLLHSCTSEKVFEDKTWTIIALGSFAQFILCGNYLWTATGLLKPEEEDEEEENVEAHCVDHNCSKGSRAKCNICTVVMTAPEMMTVTSEDKIKLITAEEVI